MYIEDSGRYYKGTMQATKSRLFLMLVQPPGTEGLEYPIKAIVRKVKMEQFGQWMMGEVRIYGEIYTVSGAYGSDGLPMEISNKVYNRIKTVLPSNLYKAWSNGGGWNSAGSEALEMKQWALKNLKALRK